MISLHILNNMTGTDDSANYTYRVEVNGQQIATGRVEGHNRADDWRALLRRLLVGASAGPSSAPRLIPSALDEVIAVCAVDGIQLKSDTDRRRQLVDDARLELADFRDGVTYGWNPLMREIARLSDALGLDDGDWADADEITLLEQFDPWTVIAAAINNIAQHPYHEACPQCWERYQAVVKERDVCIDELEHRVAVDTLKVVERFYARVCDRAEGTINRTGMVSGAHYAAMQVELDELRKRFARWAA